MNWVLHCQVGMSSNPSKVIQLNRVLHGQEGTSSTSCKVIQLIWVLHCQAGMRKSKTLPNPATSSLNLEPVAER